MLFGCCKNRFTTTPDVSRHSFPITSRLKQIYHPLPFRCTNGKVCSFVHLNGWDGFFFFQSHRNWQYMLRNARDGSKMTFTSHKQHSATFLKTNIFFLPDFLLSDCFSLPISHISHIYGKYAKIRKNGKGIPYTSHPSKNIRRIL